MEEGLMEEGLMEEGLAMGVRNSTAETSKAAVFSRAIDSRRDSHGEGSFDRTGKASVGQEDAPAARQPEARVVPADDRRIHSIWNPQSSAASTCPSFVTKSRGRWVSLILPIPARLPVKENRPIPPISRST